MKRIVMITLIALAMIALFAANQTMLLARPSVTAGDAMFTANELYEMGHFAQAAQAYEQLASQGYSDAALFYNLGNAYYKQGDYGRAIANYRRAQQLAPRDADIEANLALARSQTVDEFEAVDDGGFLNLVGGAVQGRLTLNELAMAAVGLWSLFVILFILFRTVGSGTAWRKGLQYALAATGVVLIIGVLALGSYLYVDNNQSGGVIVADEAAVTSGPGTQYATEFSLHSGAEVDLIETRGNWVRLALPDGESGDGCRLLPSNR